MAAPRPAVARPFTLMDAMILIAATAVALPGARIMMIGIGVASPGESLSGALIDLCADGDYKGAGALLAYLSALVAAAWTVAVIPLRLRRPRPPWRRLGRQPGFIAASAAALALTLLILVIARAWMVKGVAAFFVGDIELSLVVLGPSLAGAAVLGSWTTLILGRRWRAEASWPDRLGRALGAYWIAMGLGAPALAGWIFY